MDMNRLRQLAGMEQGARQSKVVNDFEPGSSNVGAEDSSVFEETIERVKQDLQPLFETEDGCNLLIDLVEFIEEGMSDCGKDVSNGQLDQNGSGEDS